MNEGDPAGELMTGAPVQDDFWATHAPNQLTSSGRMYITPAPVPTLSPDEQEALQSRLAAATSGPARSPIAPPGGAGAVVAPDLGQGIRAAFAHLPVDQAVKAIELAMQYQGQRGFVQDTQNGMPSAQAMAKWGPMLFSRSPTGIATALRLANPNQISPAEAARIALAQRQQNLREQTAKNALSPLQHQDLMVKAAALREAQRAVSSALTTEDPAVMAQARRALAAAQQDYDNFRASIGGAPVPAPVATAGPAPLVPPAPAPAAATVAPPPGLLARARNAIFGSPAPAPAAPPARNAPVSPAAPKTQVMTQAQYDALPPGTVYIGKNGKKYRKPAETPTDSEGE